MNERVILDKYGKQHPYRPLTLAELIEVERRLGGPCLQNREKLSYETVLFILASALDLKEEAVLPLFDQPTVIAAMQKIMAEGIG